jgi:hypothetical protein
MHADHPRKPAVEDILIKQTSRVDLGIITFICGSENYVFAHLYLK